MPVLLFPLNSFASVLTPLFWALTFTPDLFLIFFWFTFASGSRGLNADTKLNSGHARDNPVWFPWTPLSPAWVTDLLLETRSRERKRETRESCIQARQLADCDSEKIAEYRRTKEAGGWKTRIRSRRVAWTCRQLIACHRRHFLAVRQTVAANF